MLAPCCMLHAGAANRACLGLEEGGGGAHAAPEENAAAHTTPRGPRQARGPHRVDAQLVDLRGLRNHWCLARRFDPAQSLWWRFCFARNGAVAKQAQLQPELDAPEWAK